MTRVFAGERTFLGRCCGPIERAVYWCCGVDENEEQHWLTYAVAMLLFSIVGFVTLYALQRLQVVSAVQSAGPERGRAEPRLQHLGQLRHQHQLAVLRAARRR